MKVPEALVSIGNPPIAMLAVMSPSTLSVAFAPACSQGRAVSDGEPRIRLNATSSGWRTVDVERLPAEDLAYLESATLTAEEWAAILRVEVASANA